VRRHLKASSAATIDGSGGAARPRRTTRLALALFAALALALVIGVTLAAAVAPTVSIEGATDVSYTSAHAAGKVDPQGQPTTYRFQYLSDAQLQENLLNGFPEWEFAQTAKEETIEAAEQTVEADLAGLAPGTTYHLRLFAENADGSAEAVAATFTTDPVGPPAVSLATPTGVTGTAAHFSGTIDPEAPAGDPAAFDVNWQFELSADAGASWNPVGAGGTIPADSSSHTVEADATGLNPGGAYEVRLVASNAAGPVTAGPESFAEPAIGPAVSGLGANPNLNEATLFGTINPNGATTTYRFEYGPTAAYGLSTPAKTVAAGNAPVQVTETVLGLVPAGTYHYRLIAVNSAGVAASGDGALITIATGTPPESCPNAAVRQQQGATWLPSCRAFELVNPPGVDLGEVVRTPTASDDGTHAPYMSMVAPDAALGAQLGYTAIATRGPAGWSSSDANLSLGEKDFGGISMSWTAFSRDFSRTMVSTETGRDPEDEGRGIDGYRVDVGTGNAAWISRVPPTPAEFFYQYLGGTPDMGRVYFSFSGNNGFGSIYASAGGPLERISILPNGEETKNAFPVARLDGQLFGGIQQMEIAHGGRHAVSADGSRLFFYEATTGISSIAAPIYVRDLNAGKTVLVSASQRTGEVGTAKDAFFIAANRSGNLVYFESNEELTDDVTPGGGLYRFNVDAETLTLVVPAGNPAGLGLTEETLVSDDATHVYLSTERALTPGAQEGQPNLYLWDGSSLRLVVTGVTGLKRVSRDGRFAVIATTASIAGANNSGHLAIYEYDAATGQIACATCRPNGSPSQGDAALQATPFASINPGETQVRNIADDGSVFFSSTDRIVANDLTNARDVYGYRAGTVSLLTVGRGDDDSFLADNSDDGRNVFVLTRDSYDARDNDANELDLYDARVDGGFLAPAGDQGPKCGGENCQGGGQGSPAATAVGSATVTGAGNVKQKKKHVQKHKKKKCHKKKCPKQKGNKKGHKQSKGKAAKRDAGNNGRTGR
jgi:hypothetical protein